MVVVAGTILSMFPFVTLLLLLLLLLLQLDSDEEVLPPPPKVEDVNLIFRDKEAKKRWSKVRRREE